MAKTHEGRTDLRKAAMKRKADAWRLLRGGDQHARGAAYLAGYAIECKIKAIAMEVHDCWTLTALATKLNLDDREVYSHGLEALAMNTMPGGFYPRLRGSAVGRDFTHINAWRPSWRYNGGDWTSEKAESFLSAVDRVYEWLDSNRV